MVKYSKKSRKKSHNKGSVQTGSNAKMYKIQRSVTPNVRCMNLKFCTAVDLTVSAAVVGTHVFVANGMMDPDYTTPGTNNSPFGYDQQMALYDHYTVMKSRITVAYCNEDTGDNYVCGITVADDKTSTSTSIIDAMEKPTSKYTYLTRAGAGGSIVKLSHSYDTRKYYTGDPLDQPRLRGNTAADPADTSDYYVWAAACRNTGGGTIRLVVTIIYTALFTERRNNIPHS